MWTRAHIYLGGWILMTAAAESLVIYILFSSLEPNPSVEGCDHTFG